ncbi:hypothetical protein [Nocardia abscessus]|uniref:hypothetical protein n=1 Tax=Nocardia abscessus TaxID=120957 RepID=UPI002458F55A|nr:hypothetical protein [Nocardia abscessus]
MNDENEPLELNHGSVRDQADDGPAPLNTRERIAALSLGTVFGSAGSVAVFVSDNQAGTAALFLLTAVLLLLGVQGTPLTRLGSGEHNAEFARKIAGRILQTANDEDDPRVAEGAVRAAEIVLSPTAPTWETGGIARVLDAYEYERAVHEALYRILGGSLSSQEHRGGFDYTVGTDRHSQVAIEIKMSLRADRLERTVAQIAALSQSSGLEKVLVVTGQASTATVAMFRRMIAERAHPEVCELVVWHPGLGDRILADALAGLGAM